MVGRGTMKEKDLTGKGSGNVGNEALNLTKKELLNLGEQYLKIRNSKLKSLRKQKHSLLMVVYLHQILRHCQSQV